MGSDSDSSSRSIPPPSPPSASKKRKRVPPSDAEIEVDIHAPEPPSKKALRKAKKAKTAATVPRSSKTSATAVVIKNHSSDLEASSGDEEQKPVQRSQFGVWIGNLPFTATADALQKFLREKGALTEAQITRINLPVPNDAAAASTPGPKRIKPQNKGFAYVDVSTPEALKRALELSETLFTGRRVLIKDAKSFAGRPDKKPETSESSTRTSKPPNRRIFVGNLGFDTTREDIEEHYTPCGAVSSVHLATFEDSGKCKGYGWIEFEELEAAEAAIRGWVKINEDQVPKAVDESSGEDEEPDKKGPMKPRKWWVNKMRGRVLRTEFAEDKAVRYKKRFGKDSARKQDTEELQENQSTPVVVEVASNSSRQEAPARREAPSAKRGDRYNRKVDARKIAPGAALASAPRLTGGIVASTGKKISFD
jgi:RNA recognition motif-containing protein